MPDRMRFGTALSQFRCNDRPEMIYPASDCLVRNYNSALREQILDVTIAKREPEIEPDRLVFVMLFGYQAADAMTMPAELKRRYRDITLEDRSAVWNTDWISALELGYQLDVAEAMAHSALARREFARRASAARRLRKPRRRQFPRPQPCPLSRERSA